ncbi:sulfite exporter TauE/SafE family protein [Abyssalbus ytuae]|uniref:Probable membrane transporter protein n=1 Tax=Abyssalbus ytuae TaxID=2926907 RepID=A0A9E6ZZW5_9FLAO|nr:sulfite exporter TauE/SafE family protein [Abyssalbus ytuae]UOB18232.1 sulfite exporter TauE/SafE family protein [Abyssalbus ytuae]
MNAYVIISLLVIGILAGVLSGVLGVGGGIIMVPMLMLVLSFSQHSAQGTSLAVMLPPVTILAVLNYYKAGYLNWKYAILIAIGFIVGGYFGSKLAIKIDQKTLRKIFGVLMLIIALRMIFSKK